MEIPDTFFITFFDSVEQQLATLGLDRNNTAFAPPSLASIRQQLLTTQLGCLEKCVEQYNAAAVSSDQQLMLSLVRERLQQFGSQRHALKQVQDAMEHMNEAARRAFCRLVLCAELIRRQAQPRHLEPLLFMSRSDVVEFLGLCNVAVRLPNVKRHLATGEPHFVAEQQASPQQQANFHISLSSPQERLEAIQRLFLQAIGYDGNHGIAELKRLVFERMANDDGLAELFRNMEANMDAAIRHATSGTMGINFGNPRYDGTTRVVSVEYSELMVDVASGKVISEASNMSNDASPFHAPMPQSRMSETPHDTSGSAVSQWDMAKQTSRLHQEILGELLSLETVERQEKLQVAKRVSQSTKEALEGLRPGAERVQFLQSMHMATQRLLLMDRLWESMLRANDGKPPTIRRQQS